jgi:hypothetical protein
MPDLSAVDHIEQIVVFRPQACEPLFHQSRFHRATESRDQGLTTGELSVVLRILQYLFKKIIHDSIYQKS